jgi:DNA invertase Pin-like site-specific DNA recombinase
LKYTIVRVNTVHELATRGVGFKVLTGRGASIDTTTAAAKMVFGIFAALSEFERELISERTKAGLASARARGGESRYILDVSEARPQKETKGVEHAREYRN